MGKNNLEIDWKMNVPRPENGGNGCAKLRGLTILYLPNGEKQNIYSEDLSNKLTKWQFCL